MSEEGSASQSKEDAGCCPVPGDRSPSKSVMVTFADGQGGALVVKAEPEGPRRVRSCPEEFHACHKVQGEGPAWGSGGDWGQASGFLGRY